MNNRHDRETRLLAEIFHGDWTEGQTADFARAAAAHARRARAMRSLAVGGAGIVAAAAIALMLFSATSTPRTSVPSSAPAAKGYKIISDDQLLAELRDRPLLVVKKKNGAREFVLLDGE
ncbi:MAG TPA: hypothetical protein VHD62_06920 [Opitutaceae bacterium]|nr:hypothetical protein [Opitutaceae bacterium]